MSLEPMVPLRRLANLLKQVGEPGQCKACLAPLYWVLHRNGVRCPYDENGRPHPVTCPQVNQTKEKTK